MLKNEQPAFAQKIAFKDQFDDLFAAFQIVWCVRENNIKLLGTALQIEENICASGIHLLESEFGGCTLNKIVMYST